jgi:hypothetical protein
MQGFAQGFDASNSADFCQPGLTSVSPQTMALFGDALNEIANGEGSQVVDWPTNLLSISKCSEYFVGTSGQAGPIYSIIAKKIAKDIQFNGESALMQNYPDILDSCPGFVNFTVPQKIGFWTWFMEVLAYLESSCNPANANLHATDGVAVGLFQLNGDHAHRAGRGPSCEISDRAIRTASGNAACAVDILESQLQQNRTPFGVVGEGGFTVRKSYWQPLNPLNKRKARIKGEPHNVFMSQIADFPACRID